MTKRAKHDLLWTAAYLVAVLLAGAFVCWRLDIWVHLHQNLNH